MRRGELIAVEADDDAGEALDGGGQMPTVALGVDAGEMTFSEDKEEEISSRMTFPELFDIELREDLPSILPSELVDIESDGELEDTQTRGQRYRLDSAEKPHQRNGLQ